MTKGGKGGKGGKKGGGCPPGDAVICITQDTYDKLKGAIDNALKSTSDADGCSPDLMRVCLDKNSSYSLIQAISLGLHFGSSKKGKKGGK